MWETILKHQKDGLSCILCFASVHGAELPSAEQSKIELQVMLPRVPQLLSKICPLGKKYKLKTIKQSSA